MSQQQTTDTQTTEVPVIDDDVSSLLEGLDTGGAETPAPAGGGGTPPPAAAPAAGQSTDAAMAQTIAKIEERDAKLRQGELELQQARREFEAQRGDLAQHVDDPEGMFRAALAAKLGEQGAKDYLRRMVTSVIAEEIPELRENLPDDFKFNSELAKMQAKTRELEQRLADQKKAEEEKAEKQQANQRALNAQQKIGELFDEHFAKDHPYLATVPDRQRVIYDFWKSQPNAGQVQLPEVLAKLEKAEKANADRYRAIILAEAGKAPPAAAPAAAAPGHGQPRTPITNADVTPATPHKPLEEMSDSESIDFLAKEMERGAYTRQR